MMVLIELLAEVGRRSHLAKHIFNEILMLMMHPRGPTYTPLAYFHSRFRHFKGDGFSRHFENKFLRTYFWKLISETHSRELISRLKIRDQNLILLKKLKLFT
jgi:hypothetical protein